MHYAAPRLPDMSTTSAPLCLRGQSGGDRGMGELCDAAQPLGPNIAWPCPTVVVVRRNDRLLMHDPRQHPAIRFVRRGIPAHG